MIVAEFDMRQKRWTASIHKGARIPLTFNGLRMAQLDICTEKQRKQINNLAETSGRPKYYEYAFREAKKSYNNQVRETINKYFKPISEKIIAIMDEEGWKPVLLFYHLMCAWAKEKIPTEPLGYWLLQTVLDGEKRKAEKAELAVKRFLKSYPTLHIN